MRQAINLMGDDGVVHAGEASGTHRYTTCSVDLAKGFLTRARVVTAPVTCAWCAVMNQPAVEGERWRTADGVVHVGRKFSYAWPILCDDMTITERRSRREPGPVRTQDAPTCWLCCLYIADLGGV